MKESCFWACASHNYCWQMLTRIYITPPETGEIVKILKSFTPRGVFSIPIQLLFIVFDPKGIKLNWTWTQRESTMIEGNEKDIKAVNSRKEWTYIQKKSYVVKVKPKDSKEIESLNGHYNHQGMDRNQQDSSRNQKNEEDIIQVFILSWQLDSAFSNCAQTNRLNSRNTQPGRNAIENNQKRPNTVDIHFKSLYITTHYITMFCGILAVLNGQHSYC